MIFQLFLLKVFENNIIESRLRINYNMKIDKKEYIKDRKRMYKEYINIIYFF